MPERRPSATSEHSDANIEATHVILSALRKTHTTEKDGSFPSNAAALRVHRHSSVAFVIPSASPEGGAEPQPSSPIERQEENCATPLVLQIPLEEVQDVMTSASPYTAFGKSTGKNSGFTSKPQQHGTDLYAEDNQAPRRVSAPFSEGSGASPMLSTAGILKDFVEKRNNNGQYLASSPRAKKSGNTFKSEPASPSYIGDAQRRSLLGVDGNAAAERCHSITSLSRALQQRKGSGTSFSFGYGDDDDVSMQGRTPALQELTVVTNHVSRGFDEFGAKMLNDEYVFLQDLGSGSSGKVKLAFQPSKNRLVAVKIVRRDASAGRRSAAGAALGRIAEVRLQNLDREIHAMMKLRHNHLVALYEVIDDPDAAKLYMVMQYIDEGQLATPIPDSDGLSYTPILHLDAAIRFMRQICKGLDYLHSQGMAHHDIKPENVLRSGSDQVYLADFGLCSDVHDIDSQHFGGTVLFMAPELISKRRNHVSKMSLSAREVGITGGEGNNNQPEEEGLDPVALDIWALGITFLVLLSGKVPFRSEDEIYGVSEGEIRLVAENVVSRASASYSLHRLEERSTDEDCSNAKDALRSVDQEVLVALARAMCHLDPKHRPTARKIKTVLKRCVH